MLLAFVVFCARSGRVLVISRLQHPSHMTSIILPPGVNGFASTMTSPACLSCGRASRAPGPFSNECRPGKHVEDEAEKNRAGASVRCLRHIAPTAAAPWCPRAPASAKPLASIVEILEFGCVRSGRRRGGLSFLVVRKMYIW